LTALTEGLEVSVVALSKVKGDNDKSRIDSRYFGRAAVDLSERVSALPHAKFGEITSVFRKGIFDIKADTYVEQGGIAFVRVGDLRSGMVDPEGLAQISVEAHQAENKTALTSGDIILSKTAYPAAALVTIAECNVSQDTVAVRLSVAGKKRFRSGFIVTYLNSLVGRTLMGRLFQGNVQEHLGLSEASDLAIPEFSLAFQETVDHAVWRAHEKRVQADVSMADAESILLDALGLRDWSPAEPLSYTRLATLVAAAGRLDANYFAPRYDDVLAHLHVTGAARRLEDGLTSLVARGSQPIYADDGLPVVNSKHVQTNRVLLDESNRRAFPKALRVRTGDVLVNGTGVGTIGRAAPYLGEEEALPDNHVTIVRPDGLDPLFLSVFLNTPLGQMQIERMISGSSGQIELYPNDIRKIVVWCAPASVQEEVADHVRSSFAIEAHSNMLLSNARRAVEIAIEQGEAAALAYIVEHREVVDAAPV
jgi:type I restriction enzyme M protein